MNIYYTNIIVTFTKIKHSAMVEPSVDCNNQVICPIFIREIYCSVSFTFEDETILGG